MIFTASEERLSVLISPKLASADLNQGLPRPLITYYEGWMLLRRVGRLCHWATYTELFQVMSLQHTALVNRPCSSCGMIIMRRFLMPCTSSLSSLGGIPMLGGSARS